MRPFVTLMRLGLLLISAPAASAKAFLQSESDTDVSDMMSMLLQAGDLSEAIRARHAKDAHAQNQGELKSMFATLPKNQRGNLGLPAARYALHRLFEHRHRWFVRGLHPKINGTAGIVGKAMHAMSEIDHKGLSLPALAALAGTLEELIQREVAKQLAGFYETFGQSTGDAVSGPLLKQIVDAYMVVYISGSDFARHSKSDIKMDTDFMQKYTGDWDETSEWIAKTISAAAKAEGGCEDVSRETNACRFDFSTATRMVKNVVDAYGHFNDRQCHKLKEKLLEIEDQRIGRVKLANFYKAGLSGAWEFNEKADYLRSLGALDESVKGSPKVIVPNYVSSWVNCLTESKYYSVCCRNECEDYMMVIEKDIAAPSADADQILKVVQTQVTFAKEALPSLSLRKRLADIAKHHRGKVPLHGRLFAQWLHHAFPQTCPFPHETGKTNPQSPDEWMAKTGHVNIKATDEEVQQTVNRHEAKSKSGEDRDHAEKEDIPWSDVEELLVVRPTLPPTPSTSFLDNAIAFMEVVVVVGIVFSMMWFASSGRRPRKLHEKGEKY